MSSESVLELGKVRKTYISGNEPLEVLTDVNMKAESGEIFIISGESGSGKSTLLNLIGGLDNPTGGRIFVHGRNITVLKEDELSTFRNEHIGFVFQFHYLLRDFNALENVMMPRLMAKTNSSFSDAKQRAYHLLNEVGLDARVEHYPLELSGGERQRVVVARALMNDPTLILADEPTGNLDERNSKLVESKLFELVSKYNKTMILVTHKLGFRPEGAHFFKLEHGKLHENRAHGDLRT